MKKIILGFSRPKNPTMFSKAIMWADGTEYSHVYVKWSWDKIERDIIYQASKFAVNFESNVTFDTHAIAVEEYEIEIDDETYKEVMQFCMDNSNKPYGMKEILGFFWMKINEKLGRTIHNPFPGNGDSYICSKIGAAILQIIKKCLLKEALDDIDPYDLNSIVRGSGFKRLI